MSHDFATRFFLWRITLCRGGNVEHPTVIIYAEEFTKTTHDRFGSRDEIFVAHQGNLFRKPGDKSLYFSFATRPIACNAMDTSRIETPVTEMLYCRAYDGAGVACNMDHPCLWIGGENFSEFGHVGRRLLAPNM